MALVAIGSASHTGGQTADPTSPLKLALDAFEKSLNDDLKRQFKASTKKPDVQSVIALVAHLDAQNTAKTRRCVSSRLCTFLDKVQQFSTVVDTFVSSNPDIAALIWGGVKLALLTASNVAFYFERITAVIMEIGKSCPTYQQFGELYPDCTTLQRALCEYYAIIVRLCSKIVEVSHNSSWTHTLSTIFAPFDLEFKPVRDDLVQAVKEVERQIRFASSQAIQEAKKLLEHEAKVNANHRKLSLWSQKLSQREAEEIRVLASRQAKREAARMKYAIRYNLSDINHEKPWKQALRQKFEDTADWLCQHPVFRRWRDDSESTIVWCSGTMGMGKTVLTSSIVAQLHASCQSNEVVSYYFCQADCMNTLSARSIFGSLTRQMLAQQIEDAKDDDLQDLYDKSCENDTHDVVEFLLCRFLNEKTYYIVIDGLDQCNTDEIWEVTKHILRICKQGVACVKIFFAGRPELESTLFRKVKYNYKISINSQNTKSDVDKFITTLLEDCAETHRLKPSDPSLIGIIGNRLRLDSQGMFLWVKLSIDEICAQSSDAKVLQALERLPQGLHQLLDLALDRVRSRECSEEALKLLNFSGVLKWPLTVMEHRDLLSLEPGQKMLDRSKLPNDMQRIIADCCGLMTVDEEDDTVQYVHHSVQKHLFNPGKTHTATVDYKKTDLELGLLCMTYVNFSDFQRQVTKVHNHANVPIRPLDLGVVPLVNAGVLNKRTAQRLLRYGSQFRHLKAHEIERRSQDIVGSAGASRLESELQQREFYFLDYARNAWALHLKFLEPSDDVKWPLFCKCMQSDQGFLNKPWHCRQDVTGKVVTDKNKTRWALDNSHHALLQYFLRHESVNLNEELERRIVNNLTISNFDRFANQIIEFQESSTRTMNLAMILCARDGSINTLTRLVQAGANIAAVEGQRTVLDMAAQRGHLQIVVFLLRVGDSVGSDGAASDIGHGAALYWAACNGDLSMVELLLDAGADVNRADNNGWIPLHIAAQNGHLAVVEKLIATGADVNRADNNRGTPLYVAAQNGHLAVVEKLIATGADVNRAHDDGRTPLYVAAQLGHPAVVEKLIATGADVNRAHNDGRTPLCVAAFNGHFAVVEKLIATGADVNRADNYGWTPLCVAAFNGHFAVVEKLIVTGADVNRAQNSGRTPLYIAAQSGHSAVVEKLIATGADVNRVDNGGETPLYIAAQKGHSAVVEKLIATGADVNRANNDGWTPLYVAAQNGHLAVVEKLIATGADVNRADNNGWIPLHVAAFYGHLAVVEKLIAAGADASLRNRSKDTARDCARRHGHTEIVKILEQARAKK